LRRAAYHDDACVTSETKAAALPSALGELATAQSGVVSRAQLRALGVQRWNVRDQVRARRWRLVGRRVVVLHRGPLTSEQSLWVAALHAGPRATLAARTALAVAGLTGWDEESVHVLVPRGVAVPPMKGAIVHECRRPLGSRDAVGAPRRTSVERSAIDAGRWSGDPRAACGLLAAVVQQRLSTADRLRRELLAAGRIRHRRLLLTVLGDIEGGAHALSEIDFVVLCRRAGLPPPGQQVVRTDRSGRRRYLDARWQLPDGRTITVEIDGALHLAVLTYWDDMYRGNELVISGEHVLRYPSLAVRLDPIRVVEQLRRALAPGVGPATCHGKRAP